jgi:hypothetical protein
MTHLDDAYAALQRVVADPAAQAWTSIYRVQAAALLDEAARLVAERDRLRRERDEARATLRSIRAAARRIRATVDGGEEG